MKFIALPTTLASSLVIMSANTMTPADAAWSCGVGPSNSYYRVTESPAFRRGRGRGPSGVVAESPFSSTTRDIFRQRQEFLEKAFSQVVAPSSLSSPRYEIVNNDQEFQVAVDVPGVKLQDLDVRLEQDDTVLEIRGQREQASRGESDDNKLSFAKSFYVDPKVVNVQELTATLQNGVLTVTIPKKKTVEEELTARKIPITNLSNDNDTIKNNNAEDEKVDVPVSTKEEAPEGNSGPSNDDGEEAPKV